MTQSVREVIIAGNWKMYKTIDQALQFIDHIIPVAQTAKCKVFLAVPYTAIKACSDKAKGSSIVIGAQNMNDATEGAFTGEVAASMLKDAGASFVIVGHSERRRIFSENNSFINKKVKRALASGLKPLLCVGETFDEREQGKTEDVLKKQLQECLAGVSKNEASNCIIAYEPVWAIGTGLAATTTLAEEAHAFCRKELSTLFGEDVARNLPVLYGGSVNPENASGFLAEDDVDGLLVGSQSLVADSFAKIIQLVQNGS